MEIFCVNFDKKNRSYNSEPLNKYVLVKSNNKIMYIIREMTDFCICTRIILIDNYQPYYFHSYSLVLYQVL